MLESVNDDGGVWKGSHESEHERDGHDGLAIDVRARDHDHESGDHELPYYRHRARI
jgi:hypothetical protein